MEYEGNQETGAATATAVDEVGGTSTEVDTTGTDTMSSEGGDGFIVTEAYVVPPATQKYHKGSLQSTAVLTTTTGATALVSTFHSDSNGRDYEFKSWLPAAYAANPRISQAELTALPRPEGTNAKGNPRQTQLERFGAAVSNTTGRDILRGHDDNGRPISSDAIGRAADMQKLLIVAKEAGRTVTAAKYTTLAELVEQLNAAIIGTPVIFTTREEKNDDPQFAPKETVNGIYSYTYDVSKFKKYENAAGN